MYSLQEKKILKVIYINLFLKGTRIDERDAQCEFFFFTNADNE